MMRCLEWLALCVCFSLVVPHKPVWAADILTQLDMEQGDGPVVVDSGGSGNNGLFFGNPIYDSDTPDNSN